MTTKHLPIVVLATGMLVALMTSCGTSNETGNVSSGAAEPIEREYTELSFKNAELDDAPKKVQKWFEENKTTEQKKVFNVGGKTYVIITLGQKPTGGYDVEITQITDVKIISPQAGDDGGGNISVAYEVTEPEEGDMVTQVITYPLVIAEMDSKVDKSFQFTTPLKPEELAGDDPDQSVSHDVNSNTHSASGGASVELVLPQELTDDGKVEEGVSPGFEGKSP